MLNNKYDNITLIPLTIIIILGVLWLFLRVYSFFLDSTAVELINGIKNEYNTKLKSGEKVDINSLVVGYPKVILESYEKSVQPLKLRYQFFESFGMNKNQIEIKGYPLNFNDYNRDNFKLDNKKLLLDNNITINKRKLYISGIIKKVIDENYQTQGNWAIYFNDKLQYSSDFFISDEATESIGTHIFRYKFNEDKELYLRIVYKFQNIQTKNIEYYVNEKIINIKK